MHIVRVTLDLPMPPSANYMWRSLGRGKVRRSAEYLAWIRECDQLCLANRWRQCGVDGPYEISITFDRKRCGPTSDLGNREKPVSDWLQHAGMIANDRLAERIELKWGTAPAGCQVIIDAIEGAAA